MNEFIEKLIERLEEEAVEIYRTATVYDEPRSGLIPTGHKDISLSKVKKIVNQLAEEYNNDFCKWQPNKQFNWFLKSPHEGVGITQEEKGFFKFCPCCGKKIKVVE